MLTEKQAAEQLGVAPTTLRSWRCRGIGPTYVKMGRGINSPIRYTVPDLDAFIAESRRTSLVRGAHEE